MRRLLPFLLLIAALGLFVGYTNGTYQGAKAIAAENGNYVQALATSHQLKEQRDKLLARADAFNQDGKQKLENLLPDNVDNIRLIIDINNVAARHGLTLKNVLLGDVSSGATSRSQVVAAGVSADLVGSVELGFTVSASYDKFTSFLNDLEHSLRLMDVEKLSFKTVGTADNNDYAITVRTYWLH